MQRFVQHKFSHIFTQFTASEPAESPAGMLNWQVNGNWFVPTARTTELVPMTKYGCTGSKSWTGAVVFVSLHRICCPALLRPVTINVESVPFRDS